MIALSSSHPVYGDLLEIQKAADRAANLIRQLLAFSRRQTLKPQVISLNNILLETDKMLRRLIGEHIELVTLAAPNLHSIRVDPGQLEQVLVNLAINARDAMAAGGKLTLETVNFTADDGYARENPGMAPGEYVRLVVADTGIGMNEEVKTHLFEPFFTTKEKGKGTGLGLATCYGIIKQSGGYIQVSSEPGQGTTFRIYFPKVEGSAPLHDAQEEAVRLPEGTETLLLAEDEPSVRTMTGYTVIEASNGEEALRLVEKHGGQPLHLLVTDVVMPRMGGKELADHLRTLQEGIKVLFISGYTDDAITHHGVLEPATDFLRKPFSLTDITKKVREVLDRP
jgi:two-component system cell cycle sensor histidine kinase/response regulator CckA